MYSYQELTNLPQTERRSELQKTLSELHLARLSLKTNQLKETHKVKQLKRYIAQIKTSLNEEQPSVADQKKEEVKTA